MILLRNVGLSAMLLAGNAYAEGGAAQDNPVMQFLPLIVLIVVFYLLILRPQQKRAKEQKSMLDALQKGDEIVTIGGVLGKVSKVSDDYLGLEVADGTVLQIQRVAVQNLLPKGTIKSL